VVVLGLSDLYYLINKYPVASTGGTLSICLEIRSRTKNFLLKPLAFYLLLISIDFNH
jgi:hypothetical protein